jgi:hypothetical protein
MTALMLILRIALSILAPLLLPPIEAYERWQHRKRLRVIRGGK